MTDLKIDICPETGICSIGRSSTEKIDLMPDEVADIRDAGDIDGVKAVIDENDPSFAGTLNAEELAQIKRAVE